jgi:hypothetical protein
MSPTASYPIDDLFKIKAMDMIGEAKTQQGLSKTYLGVPRATADTVNEYQTLLCLSQNVRKADARSRMSKAESARGKEVFLSILHCKHERGA